MNSLHSKQIPVQVAPEPLPMTMRPAIQTGGQAIAKTWRIGEITPSRMHYLAVLEDLKQHHLFYQDYLAKLDCVLMNFYSFDEHQAMPGNMRQRRLWAYQTDRRYIAQTLNRIGTLMREATDHPGDSRFMTDYYHPREPLPQELWGQSLDSPGVPQGPHPSGEGTAPGKLYPFERKQTA